MLNSILSKKEKNEVPPVPNLSGIFSSGKKNYPARMLKPGFSSGMSTETKVLIAKVTLVVCILILIAAKSFN